jgi:hypothetical protein
VRLDANDYSVHPAVIGRRVEMRAVLHRVQVFREGKVVADHERAWAKHQTLSDPGHVQAVQVRDLSEYDTGVAPTQAARPLHRRAGGDRNPAGRGRPEP